MPHLNEAERLESNFSFFFNWPLRDFITWLSETNDLDFWESFLLPMCILQCLPQTILNLCLSMSLPGPRFGARPRVLTLARAAHCSSAFPSFLALPCLLFPSSLGFVHLPLHVSLSCSMACFRKLSISGCPSEMYFSVSKKIVNLKKMTSLQSNVVLSNKINRKKT